MLMDDIGVRGKKASECRTAERKRRETIYTKRLRLMEVGRSGEYLGKCTLEYDALR